LFFIGPYLTHVEQQIRNSYIITVESMKVWMDGPHLKLAGDLCRGQAVLFRVWWGLRDSLSQHSEAYRMGYVLDFDDDCVLLDLDGDKVSSRRDCMYTHPDMITESRARKIENLGL
jgi:hypothetical protein